MPNLPTLSTSHFVNSHLVNVDKVGIDEVGINPADVFVCVCVCVCLCMRVCVHVCVCVCVCGNCTIQLLPSPRTQAVQRPGYEASLPKTQPTQDACGHANW